MDEGVIAHVQGGKYFPCKVINPIMEIFMAIRNEAALLAVQRMIER